MEGSFYDYLSSGPYELRVTVQIGGLVPLTSYSFAYIPVNVVSACPDSTPLTVQATEFQTTGATLPSPVTWMGSSGATGGGISVLWDVPMDTGSAGPIYYQLYMSYALNNPVWGLVYNGTAVSLWKTKLTKSTDYKFMVACQNEIGYSPNSSEYTFTTSYISVPGPVSELSMDSSTGGMIQLSWTAPEDDGGSAVRGYNVYATDGSTQELHFKEALTTTVQVGGLLANRVYLFSVYAINDLGEATDAPSQSFMTGNTTPPTKPGDIMVIQSSGGAAELAMPSPEDTGGVALEQLQYLVYANGIRIAAKSIKSSSIGSSESLGRRLEAVAQRRSTSRRLAEDVIYSISILVGGLLPTTDYSFSVLLTNDAGQSNESVNAAGATSQISVPGIPSEPTIEYATGGSLHLAWQNPVDTGGTPVTSFRLLVKNGDTVVGLCEGLISRCTVTDLFPMVDYTVTLTAFNAFGASNPSSPKIYSTGMPSTPQAPKKLAIDTLTNTTALLLWDPCTDFGGTFVELYTVEAVQVTDPSMVVTAKVPITTLNATLDMLTPATRYVATVVGILLCQTLIAFSVDITLT